MDYVDVVIPTYYRLVHLPAILEDMSVTEGASPLFIVHESDNATVNFMKTHKQRYILVSGAPSGVKSTNIGFQNATSEWVVIGQDDMRYRPGWLAEAMSVAREGDVEVVGFNDLYEARTDREYSVSWLVRREFVEEVGLAYGAPGFVFWPGYKKLWADTELVSLARARKVYKFVPTAVTEHLHHSVQKSEIDSTYINIEKFASLDEALFKERSIWWS